MTRAPIRILLVEDNEVYRSSLELLLGLQADFEIVAAVSSGADAADTAASTHADVVVMDYRLPGLDGTGATRAVRERSRAAVVCLTAEATPDERAAVLEAGAVALVEKGGRTDVLADAIRRAAAESASR